MKLLNPSFGRPNIKSFYWNTLLSLKGIVLRKFIGMFTIIWSCLWWSQKKKKRYFTTSNPPQEEVPYLFIPTLLRINMISKNLNTYEEKLYLILQKYVPSSIWLICNSLTVTKLLSKTRNWNSYSSISVTKWSLRYKARNGKDPVS